LIGELCQDVTLQFGGPPKTLPSIGRGENQDAGLAGVGVELFLQRRDVRGNRAIRLLGTAARRHGEQQNERQGTGDSRARHPVIVRDGALQKVE
jgi:hypothetical protein